MLKQTITSLDEVDDFVTFIFHMGHIFVVDSTIILGLQITSIFIIDVSVNG